MSLDTELRDRVRRYYATYYRDVLGIPDWPVLVGLREEEERQEQSRLDRLRALLGPAAVHGRILNVGCGTGGFNVVAAGAGARTVGVDSDPEAIAICGLKRRRGGAFVRAVAEALPFSDSAFDLVYCFSAIEHVESVEASVREMVRVTRRGGAIYLHTPNAWSWYEGHYKLFWAPFLPQPLGRLYLRLRCRPTDYLATLRRLTPAQVRRAFVRAGAGEVRFYGEDRPRESLGPLRVPLGLYYRFSGVSPFIEAVAVKA